MAVKGMVWWLVWPEDLNELVRLTPTPWAVQGPYNTAVVSHLYVVLILHPVPILFSPSALVKTSNYTLRALLFPLSLYFRA